MGSKTRGFGLGGLDLGLVTPPFHARSALGVLKSRHNAEWHWALGDGKPVGSAQPTIRLVARARSGDHIANLCNQALELLLGTIEAQR